MNTGGNTRNRQAWKMTAPGSTSRTVFLASPSYAWAAVSPPRWPSATSPPWLAAGRLWPLSGYCCLHNPTQLFHFSLPDTGYFRLHSATVVLLQSTWHRLLLSAQCNSCFTSVYLTQVTSVCTTQLFHFSQPDTGYCHLHNATVSLQSTDRLLPSAQRNCYFCLQNAVVLLQSTWHWQVLSVQRNCSTSLYLILVIGYCCLHNTIVSLQSTYRLLLSAQHNCFTSVQPDTSYTRNPTPTTPPR